jgi:hypothetical protein
VNADPDLALKMKMRIYADADPGPGYTLKTKILSKEKNVPGSGSALRMRIWFQATN